VGYVIKHLVCGQFKFVCGAFSSSSSSSFSSLLSRDLGVSIELIELIDIERKDLVEGIDWKFWLIHVGSTFFFDVKKKKKRKNDNNSFFFNEITIFQWQKKRLLALDIRFSFHYFFFFKKLIRRQGKEMISVSLMMKRAF